MWILITLLAVISQILRNLFSKKLSKELSSETVSMCRFLYAIPVVALGYLIGKYFLGNVEILSFEFFLWTTFFGFSQIIANALLVSLFHEKNFAVAITYIKTETIFTAILAFFFLSETLSILGWLGVIVAFIGLILTSFAKERVTFRALQKSLFQKSTYKGLIAGLFFAVAVITIKTSFQYIESETIFMESLFALLIALITQVILLLPYILWKRKYEFIHILQNPKIPFLIGTFSGLGSFFWFFAFALTYVAYVKTLGQIEFLLGIVISAYYLKEKIYKNEVFGMILMMIGSIILILI